MTNGEPSNIPTIDEEQLSPDAIVYRAVLRKTLVDETKHPLHFSPDLFIPRPRGGLDDDGLSVGIAAKCSPMQVAEKFKKCYGVVSLRVEQIQALRLRIVPDPEDETHALIQGVPFKEESPEEADTIARDLTDICFDFVRLSYVRR